VTDPADPVVIGIVASPHGVHGTVKVREAGSGRHLREGMEPVVGGSRRRIVSVRQTGKGYLVDFEGIDSRIGAVAIRGKELLLDRKELDEPDEDEFYVGDLIGLRVEDADGNSIGTVADLLENAGNELLVIYPPDSMALYVPFTVEHVPTVDLAGGTVVVRPPQE
jgi:16S rRNA processing protein RimM